jgi:hypothetical protein
MPMSFLNRLGKASKASWGRMLCASGWHNWRTEKTRESATRCCRRCDRWEVADLMNERWVLLAAAKRSKVKHRPSGP